MLHYIEFKSTNFCYAYFNISSRIYSLGLAYEAKPAINDEVTINWEEKNTNKRNKLLNIINESFIN